MTTQLDTLIAAALERRVIREREERARKDAERAAHYTGLITNFREWYAGAFSDRLRDALETAGAEIVVPPGKDAARLIWPQGPATEVGLTGQDSHWMLEFVARSGVAGSAWQLTTPSCDYVRIGSERETNLDDVLLCAIADWHVKWKAEHATAPVHETESPEEAPF